MLPLSSVIFCVSGIATGSKTGSFSDVLGDYVDNCGTTIYISSFSPRIPLTEAFFIGHYTTLNFFQKSLCQYGVACHPFS